MPQHVSESDVFDQRIAGRAAELFAENQAKLSRQTDHLFAWLMVCQWVAGIAAAFWISPRTWAGAESQTHIHVYAAIFLGGLITIFPRRGADAHIGSVDPSHWRAHRDPFSRLWLARHLGVLS
jgi:hypothetical protein